MPRKSPPATTEEVKQYFAQYYGYKSEPYGDHLNDNKGPELHFRAETMAQAKRNDVGPDGIPFNEKQRNKINIINVLN